MVGFDQGCEKAPSVRALRSEPQACMLDVPLGQMLAEVHTQNSETQAGCTQACSSLYMTQPCTPCARGLEACSQQPQNPERDP